MKLYTEEEVRKAVAMGYDWCHQKQIPSDFMIDSFIKSLTPIELPTDEEIEDVSGGDISFEFGAQWLRDKIQGGNK